MAPALLVDPWVRGCALAGALLAGLHAVAGLPWALWLAWAWLAGLSAYDARPRDTSHSEPRAGVWQTRPDE
ncbi:hypothetical protein [Nocardioides litoris]|uniref:hypothetical protein n=1 Tax=Nocardioides litoris TaxID=1926648 RepID=UPI001124019D|nr:hypothetical protein [Nocardioides litoris]